MWRAVQSTHGTAAKAKHGLRDRFRVALKTGTAQIARRRFPQDVLRQQISVEKDGRTVVRGVISYPGGGTRGIGVLL